MRMQRSIRTSLAGAIAMALCGVASIATAQAMPQQQPTQQVPPPPPPPPMPPSAPMPPPAPPTTASTPPAAAPMSTQSQPPMAPNPQQGASTEFRQGTQSSATYPIQNGTLTVNSGMPENTRDYGPPPPFQTLDTNRDGRISHAEAKAYPPLDSDFLFASRQAQTISKSQYQRWVQNQN